MIPKKIYIEIALVKIKVGADLITGKMQKLKIKKQLVLCRNFQPFIKRSSKYYMSNINFVKETYNET